MIKNRGENPIFIFDLDGTTVDSRHRTSMPFNLDYWNENSTNDIELPCSRIEITKENVNIFDKNTWASVFRFYEENLIKFDSFWIEFKEVFKQLED